MVEHLKRRITLLFGLFRKIPHGARNDGVQHILLPLVIGAGGDIENNAYVKLTTRLIGINDLEHAKRFLYTVARRYLAELHRNTHTSLRAIRALAREKDRTVSSHSATTTELETHRALLADTIESAPVLRDMNTFKTSTFVLHTLCDRRYPQIASLFERCAGNPNCSPATAKDQILHDADSLEGQAHAFAMRFLVHIHPKRDEVEELMSNLRNRGSEYWDYKAKACGRLHSWKMQVVIRLIAHLKKSGITASGNSE